MDKWDESVERIKNAVLAEEPEAALTGALGMFAEFGRALENISFDLDRLATAAEIANEAQGRPTEPEATPEPEKIVHDL